eukprot:UN13744
MSLIQVSNLDKESLHRMQHSAEMMLAKAFVEKDCFTIHQHYYNLCPFVDETKIDFQNISSVNKKRICLVNDNEREAAIGAMLGFTSWQEETNDENMRIQRSVSILGLVLAETLGQLELITIMFIRQNINHVRCKLVAFMD